MKKEIAQWCWTIFVALFSIYIVTSITMSVAIIWLIGWFSSIAAIFGGSIIQHWDN